MMRIVLKDIPNVVNFIDDMLIYTKDWKTHVKVPEEVLSRLRRANLGVKPKKCSIAMKEVEFLGQIIGGGTMRTKPDLVQKIKEAPRPTTKKQIRSFLGLTGFYRNYFISR